MKDFKRQYISLGGWCGTAIGLRDTGLRNCSLPFDWTRSKFEGVVDCLEHDFKNFFPDPLVVEYFTYWGNGKLPVFRGKNISFLHDDLNNVTEIKKYNRRVARFIQLLTTQKENIFLRTTITTNYEDEIKLTEKFHDAMKRNYPNTNYILVFIIPEQKTTEFVKKIDTKTLCFTLNDLSHDNKNLGNEYRPIFDFIENNDVYEDLPQSNVDIELKTRLNNEELGIPPVFI